MNPSHPPGANTSHDPADDLIIAVPVYNDWASAVVLLARLDATLAGLGRRGRVVFIDDGSTEAPFADERIPHLTAVKAVNVLSLARNLGHQRAIAIGLSYVHAHLPCRGLIIMDADGEDNPADIPLLLDRVEAEGEGNVVFAGRARRSEGVLFQTFYQLFKAAHFLLTGIKVRFGNFSVIPGPLLARLVSVPDLWNHYAAAVVKSRIPYTVVPTHRARRIAGRSRMNFVSLVVHGLSAVSVFSDRVGVRLLVALLAVTMIFGAGLAALVGLGLIGDVVVPGWIYYLTGFLSILLAHMVLLALVFIFVILAGRSGPSFIPSRDYPFFVLDYRTLDLSQEARCL